MVSCALAVSRGTRWVFSKNMWPGADFRPIRAQESQIESAGLLNPERFGQQEMLLLAAGQKNCHAVHQQRSRKLVHNCLSILSRSVSALSSRPNSIRVLR